MSRVFWFTARRGPSPRPVCLLGEVRPGRWSVSVDAGSVFVLTWAFHAESAERRAEFAEKNLGQTHTGCGGESPSLRILRVAPRSLREKRTTSGHRRGHAKAISVPRRPACWFDLSSGRTGNGSRSSLHQVAAALAHTGDAHHRRPAFHALIVGGGPSTQPALERFHSPSQQRTLAAQCQRPRRTSKATARNEPHFERYS
jgi:hypothetical protein